MKKGKADQFLMGADSSDEDSDEGDKTVVFPQRTSVSSKWMPPFRTSRT